MNSMRTAINITLSVHTQQSRDNAQEATACSINRRVSFDDVTHSGHKSTLLGHNNNHAQHTFTPSHTSYSKRLGERVVGHHYEIQSVDRMEWLFRLFVGLGIMDTPAIGPPGHTGRPTFLASERPSTLLPLGNNP